MTPSLGVDADDFEAFVQPSGHESAEAAGNAGHQNFFH
jgi:hypothetical protein